MIPTTYLLPLQIGSRARRCTKHYWYVVCLWLLCSPLVGQTATVELIYNTSNSPLPHNQANALALSSNGTLWIGTEEGLAQLLGGQWQIYNTNNSGLTDDRVRSLALQGNTIFAGTFIGGLCLYDQATWKTYTTLTSGLPDNTVRGIAFNNNTQTVWLGTTGGLAVWQPADDVWTAYFVVSPSLSINNLNHLAFDAQYTAWIATLNAGLIAFDGEGFQSYKTNNSGIPDNSIERVMITPDGSKWLATTFHGLARLDIDEVWTIWDNTNSPLTANELTTVSRDPAGRLLIGSRTAGLFIADIDSGTWLHLDTTNSNLPNNRITQVIADSDSTLWVATHGGGIARIHYGDFPTALHIAPTPSKLNPTLNIYPNPIANGTTLHLRINTHKLPDTAPNIPTTAILYNLCGAEVARQTTNNLPTDWQLPALPQGLYYVCVATANGNMLRTPLFIGQ